MTGSERAHCACDTPRGETIARLNDTLRKTGKGGLIVMTRGIQALNAFDPIRITQLLSSYEAFDADNDPHGERDFGDIDLDGQSIFWKIDYYDMQMLYGSPDPADPEVTQRVLTLLLPEEW